MSNIFCSDESPPAKSRRPEGPGDIPVSKIKVLFCYIGFYVWKFWEL